MTGGKHAYLREARHPLESRCWRCGILTSIMIQERLGEFYLGRHADDHSPYTYDASDLTTHAVIIGMTGSGKTGLGIAMIEEAILDGVPVIAIDPKGDLGNLALTFPKLEAGDFLPYIDMAKAESEGKTPGDVALATAKLWREGLASWDQGPARMQSLKDAAGVTVYTPGSTAGTPLSALKAFTAPPEDITGDAELLAERVEGTVTGLLGLLDITADPLNSSEHILLSNLLLGAWRERRDVTLADLIRGAQEPPFESIGVLPVDDVISPNARKKLATSLNNLIASPSFAPWLSGEALHIPTLLREPNGRPRVAVINLSHLSDPERMFAITLVLNEVVGWLRTLEGTGTLRAILYIDEVFGIMPPTQNPPSKKPLLTLLKQARAYGLGVTLSTQNPVDLDYKGLSNTGTWFIGRLQTPQDRDRVLDGLTTASGAGPDRKELSGILGGLAKRVFLSHNIHEPAPSVFQTRWVMNYLAGPLSRAQLKQLTPATKATLPSPPAAAAPATPVVAHAAGLPPEVSQYHLRPLTAGLATYFPYALALADIRYQQSRLKLDHNTRVATITELQGGPIVVDWSAGAPLPADPDMLTQGPPPDGEIIPPPDSISKTDPAAWLKSYRHHATQTAITLYRHDSTGMSSQPGEALEDFMGRVVTAQREARDREKADITQRAQKRIKSLEQRASRALAELEKQRGQARHRQLDAAVNVGNALLGAVLGGRRRSLNSTLSSLNRAGKERGDVRDAQRELASIQDEIQALEVELAEQLDAMRTTEPTVDTVSVRPKSTHVLVHTTAVVWLPHARTQRGYEPLFTPKGGPA